MLWYNRFLGIDHLPSDARNLIHKINILVLIPYLFSFSISVTFLVLHVLTFVSYTELAVLLSIASVIQLLLDYPSGSLGDKIGQKWVLIIGATLQAVYYLIIAVSNQFEEFLVGYIVLAISNSQTSGALESWFDNHYQVLVGDRDPNRKTYRYYRMRFRIVFLLTSSIFFVIGGTLANFYDRILVFYIQAAAFILISILYYIIMSEIDNRAKQAKIMSDDEGDGGKENENLMTQLSYFSILKSGLLLFIKNKGLRYYTVAMTLFGIVALFLEDYLYHPLLFAYSGADSLTSGFRAVVIVVSMPFLYKAGSWSSNINRYNWKIRIEFIYLLVLLTPFIVILTLFPVNINNQVGDLNLRVLSIILIAAVFGSVLYSVKIALGGSIILDHVPSEFRNSYYSIAPSIRVIISVPLILGGGYLIDNYPIFVVFIYLYIIGIISSILLYKGINHLRSNEGKISINP